MPYDSLQRFIFENSDVRGELVSLDKSFQQIICTHHYPKAILNALGQIVSAAVLLSATLKFEGQLTVQFQSDKAVQLIVAKCNDKFDIRALAQYDNASFLDENSLFTDGQLVITIESNNQVKPYQSIVPLESPSIAKNLENYFNQSVQIPTKIWLAISDQKVRGMLLQQLPKQDQTFSERQALWEYAIQMAETLTEQEFLGLDNKTILHRLYHEHSIELFDAAPIQFKCPCSQARMENLLKMLGKKEALDILKTESTIDITCEYCNKVYSFDDMDVSTIQFD